MRLVSTATATLAALVTLLPAYVFADADYHIDLDSYEEGAFGDVPKQKFHSSNIIAPRYQINYWNHDKVDTSDRFIFMAGEYGKWGPSIVSSKDLSLVWADQHYGGLAQVARTWDLNGTRVMASFSDWAVRIYDESYKQIHTLGPQGHFKGKVPDSHEAGLTYDGNILLFVCPGKRMNLTDVGGKEDQYVSDCTIQEIEPKTKEVLFEWATSSYFGPEDSYMKPKNEKIWDYCHMNAVEKTEDGNYLISYRHLATVILVDGKTKEVIWQMWGKKNQFEDITPGNGSAKFAFQHEARMSGKNRFTVFDNHNKGHNGYCKEEFQGNCSRGLEVEFDPDKKTVWVANEWYHPSSLISASRGGVQRTPSGNVVVAWGQNPSYTEYTPDGELAMDIQRGRIRHMEHGIFPVITYRIWKGDWIGRPSWGPNISCNNDDIGRSIYVSWNGATEVDRWVMLMAEDTENLNGADKVVAQSPRNGFETQFELQNMKILPYARIAALDINGTIIGSTPAVDTLKYDLIDLEYDIDEVFMAGTKTLSQGIHSSAGVTIPSGTRVPEGSPIPSALKKPEFEPEFDPDPIDDNKGDDEEYDGEEDKESSSSSMYSPRVVGGAVAGIAFCAVAIMSLVIFLRYREKSQSSPSDPKSEAAYGLLANGGEEPYQDREDNSNRSKYEDVEETTREVSSSSSSDAR